MTPSPAVPDRVLEFEAPEVHALVWLPLAVRYKLDVIGCRLRLAQWQAIAPAARAALLACAAGEPSRRLLLDLVPDATLQAGRDTALIGSYECYLAGRLARPRAAAPALHSGPPNAPFM